MDRHKLQVNMLLHYFSEYSEGFMTIQIQSVEFTTNGGVRVMDADTKGYLGDAQPQHLHKFNTPMKQVKASIGL